MAYADGNDDHIADDGIERASDGVSLGEDPDALGADGLPPVERDLGFMLDEEDLEKVAKHAVKQRADQNERRSRDRAVWKRNRWWREGKRNIRIEKVQDTGMWRASLMPGMGSAPPTPNKTDRLCRRITNTLLADKPYPDCEPSGDDNEDRDAAEFATRYLKAKGAPAELNMPRILRSASDKAQTYASAFAIVTMDPAGRGHRPRTMKAHPAAQHEDDAYTDPSSGLRAPDEALMERYVRPDGYLTGKVADADLQWIPGHKVRLVNGLQLDLLPPTAKNMDEAVGVSFVDSTTLGDLRLQFQDAIKKLTPSEMETVCRWRPDNVEDDILPPGTSMPADQFEEGSKAERGAGAKVYKDSHTVFVLVTYYRSHAEYPLGAYVVCAGETTVLHRQTWVANMEGRDGTMTQECLMIPVAQCGCLDDDTSDNPMGIAMSEHLGPADEVRHAALGFELEHMFRSANPIPFLPIGSIVQPKQFLLRDGNPVFTNPQGKPEWEVVPALSSTVPELRSEMGDEMNDESGLQQAGQGVEDPTVKSGIHAQTIVAEALKALTNMKDNLGDFYIRVNQIILEHARAFCDVPDLIEYVGEDGRYKQKEWSRTDFGTTKRVSIAKGSFTMHTLLAKQEMANNAFDRQVIDADDYKELIAGGVSPVLGTQDNPHLMRVRRQIDVFDEGPTPEWLQAKAAVDQQNAAAAQAFQTATATAAMMAPVAPAASSVAPMPPDVAPGAPGIAPPVSEVAAVPAPPPVIPDPPGPFEPRLPVDLEPMPAKIRHRQLSRAQVDTRFERWPAAWQQKLLDEYLAMKNAAGIMTVPEVQAAKAAEQQATAAAGAQQQNAATQAQAGEAQARASNDAAKLDLDRKKLELAAVDTAAQAADRHRAHHAESERAAKPLTDDEMRGIAERLYDRHTQARPQKQPFG